MQEVRYRKDRLYIGLIDLHGYITWLNWVLRNHSLLFEFVGPYLITHKCSYGKAASFAWYTHIPCFI